MCKKNKRSMSQLKEEGQRGGEREKKLEGETFQFKPENMRNNKKLTSTK